MVSLKKKYDGFEGSYYLLYDTKLLFLEERNRADQTIHDIESKLNEYKDQLDADEVKTLQDDAARVSSIFRTFHLSNFFR